MKVIVCVIIAVVSIASSTGDHDLHDGPNPIATALDNAYNDNSAFWASIQYGNGLPFVPGHRYSLAQEHALLLGALISVYMNQLRLEHRRPSPLARFVSSLPYDAGVDFTPAPYVSQLSPQRPDPPLISLLSMISNVVAGGSPDPPLPSPLYASQLTGSIFGRMLVTGLFSGDERSTALVIRFLDTYVRKMELGNVSAMTALALLARDLCLAQASSDPEGDFNAACELLRRVPKADDLPLDLSYSDGLISGLTRKLAPSDVPEMSFSQQVDFLASALLLGNTGLRSLCQRRSQQYKGLVGARLVVLLEKVVFAMSVSNRMDQLDRLQDAMKRRFQTMGLSWMLVLFCSENHALMDHMRQRAAGLSQMGDAITESLKILGTDGPQPAAAVRLPIEYVIDVLREAEPTTDSNVSQWPIHW